MLLKDCGKTAAQIKELASKYMIETYERFDFVCQRAEGMHLYDENDAPWLDFYGGIAVNSAGNVNPKVVAAVQDQVKDVIHTFNYPYTIPQALLAEKICLTLGYDKIFFQSTGTEANEAMIKMARKYGIEKYGPERFHIVSAKSSFHGRSIGALTATGQPASACHIGFGPLVPGFSYADWNNLASFESLVTDKTIAVMIEPVQGEGGVNPASEEFIKAWSICASGKTCFSWLTRSRPAGGGPAKSWATCATASSPTSSPWPRAWAAGCPSRPYAPKPRWPRPSPWAPTGRLTAATPYAARPPWPKSPRSWTGICPKTPPSWANTSKTP